MRDKGSGSASLWIQIALAIAYGVSLRYFGSLTGKDTLDGIVGVMLGLYISSHPARNAIDVLFADRFALRLISSTWEGVCWISLNVLVLLAGWVVIFLGVLRVVRDYP